MRTAIAVIVLGSLIALSNADGWVWQCGGPPSCISTRVCSPQASGGCTGSSNSTQSCLGQAGTSCAAGSGGWTSFGPCSALCQAAGGAAPTQQRVCASGSCSGSTSQTCNTQTCADCQYTQLSGYSQCSAQCGGGKNSRTLTITAAPSPGGKPCPPTIYWYPCNTHYCGDVMYGYGDYVWGPVEGTGQTITVEVQSWQYNVDVFVFNNFNYQQYSTDSLRQPPYNYGYLPVDSRLNVNNAQMTVTLPAGDQYWIVIDNTWVGAANGDGNNQFTQLNFNYKIANPDGTSVTTLPPPQNFAGAFSVAPVLATIAALLALALAGPRHLF